jgi:hypothetical protein
MMLGRLSSMVTEKLVRGDVARLAPPPSASFPLRLSHRHHHSPAPRRATRPRCQRHADSAQKAFRAVGVEGELRHYVRMFLL